MDALTPSKKPPENHFLAVLFVVILNLANQLYS